MPDIDVARLVDLVTVRIQAVLPDGFVLLPDPGEGYVRMSGHGASAGLPIEENLGFYDSSPPSAEEGLAKCCCRTLDLLQDKVDQCRREPWPGRRVPPKAMAEVRDGRIILRPGQDSYVLVATYSCTVGGEAVAAVLRLVPPGTTKPLFLKLRSGLFEYCKDQLNTAALSPVEATVRQTVP